MGKRQIETNNQRKMEEPFTLRERRGDGGAEEVTKPVNPMWYAMLPSALNSPKFLSDVGPGFRFSLNSANTYAFAAIFGR